MSFYEFIDRLDDVTTNEELMVAVFERHDFILKANFMLHTSLLIRRLQDEIDTQQNSM